MRYSALGLVEVRGYLGAVAAADAALKAASVTCIGVEIIKGGLVTVKLEGDVGAVQAAVAAGAEMAKQLNVLLTRHVIARMHEETAALVEGLHDADASPRPADGAADKLPQKQAVEAAEMDAGQWAGSGEIKEDASEAQPESIPPITEEIQLRAAEEKSTTAIKEAEIAKDGVKQADAAEKSSSPDKKQTDALNNKDNDGKPRAQPKQTSAAKVGKKSNKASS